MSTTEKTLRRSRLASVGLDVPELRRDAWQRRDPNREKHYAKHAAQFRRYNCGQCGRERSCRLLVVHKESGARICRVCLGEAVNRWVQANFAAHPVAVKVKGGAPCLHHGPSVRKSASHRAKLSAAMKGNQNARKYLSPDGRIE